MNKQTSYIVSFHGDEASDFMWWVKLDYCKGVTVRKLEKHECDRFYCQLDANAEQPEAEKQGRECGVGEGCPVYEETLMDHARQQAEIVKQKTEEKQP